MLGYVIFWNLTHQQQIKEALKTKQENVPYGHKIPVNYTREQKRWTIIIVAYLLLLVLFCAFFLLNGFQNVLSLLLPLGIVGWLLLIKKGNIKTK
jgi:uncharacterized membrane protein